MEKKAVKAEPEMTQKEKHLYIAATDWEQTAKLLDASLEDAKKQIKSLKRKVARLSPPTKSI